MSAVGSCTAPKIMPGMISQHLPFSTLIINLNAAVFDDSVYLFCNDKTKSSEKESVFCFLQSDAKTVDWKQGRLLKTSFNVDTDCTVHCNPYYFRKTLPQRGSAVGYGYSESLV